MSKETESRPALFVKVVYDFDEIEHGVCCAYLFNMLDNQWYQYTDYCEPLIDDFKDYVEYFINTGVFINVIGNTIESFDI